MMKTAVDRHTNIVYVYTYCVISLINNGKMLQNTTSQIYVTETNISRADTEAGELGDIDEPTVSWLRGQTKDSYIPVSVL